MSQRRLGIAIGRRAVSAVGLERAGRDGALHGPWRVQRAAGESLDAALSRLCAQIPDEWRAASLHLALSSIDLACADLLEVPYSGEKQILRVAGSLAEGRCAGESIEELAIDVLVVGRASSLMEAPSSPPSPYPLPQRGEGLAQPPSQGAVRAVSRIQLGAMRVARLNELTATVSRLFPKASLDLVVPMPFSLIRALPEGDGLWGVSLGGMGEGAVWEREGGEVRRLRVFPMEGATEDCLALLDQNARSLNSASAELQVMDGPAPVRGVSSDGVAPEELAAVGAALSDPVNTVNLLRGAPDAKHSIMDHLRAPLLSSAVAATILFLAAGLYFDRCARQHETDLERCREKEQAAWKQTYGADPYREGGLTARLQREVALARKVDSANDQPSALRLWGELSAVLPNAEQTGMTLDELHLTRRGGRLQAKVPVNEKNPLETASLIESSINRSPAVAARGEFERREGQITLRMQLDYKPQSEKGREP